MFLMIDQSNLVNRDATVCEFLGSAHCEFNGVSTRRRGESSQGAADVRTGVGRTEKVRRTAEASEAAAETSGEMGELQS